MINGYGMVLMFRCDNGHVDFKSRYVRTENFMLERAARRSLFVSSFPSMKTINMAEYGYEDDSRHSRSDLSAVEKPRG